MKLFLLLLVSSFVLVGCKTSYDVILTNGTKIQNVSKPVLDEKTDRYKFTLPEGKEVKVSATRVRTIEPHGESSEPQFVSPTQKK